MKYMGSKRAMLANGLGETLLAEVRANENGFVDLFSGSGAVSRFVARSTNVRVTAIDLQCFSRDLSDCVIGRVSPLDADKLWRKWRDTAKQFDLVQKQANEDLTVAAVHEMRTRCERGSLATPLTRAYGGHYFSEYQARCLDALMQALPRESTQATLCRAALIVAASKCSASPGHTAQPLQPTRHSISFICKAWKQDPLVEAQVALQRLAREFAMTRGQALVADANAAVWSLQPRQVVFIDPPYSAVQYSRFYHVLESIAVGASFSPEGAGRYPPSNLRPRSFYSMKGEARFALEELFLALSEIETTCIVTFPNHICSNGLSAAEIESIGSHFFKVDKRFVKSTFSTLGGTSKFDETVQGRAARHLAEEAILVLRPKHSINAARSGKHKGSGSIFVDV